jgi:hypothetical protein
MTAKQATTLARGAAEEFYNALFNQIVSLVNNAFDDAKEWEDARNEAGQQLRDLAKEFGSTLVKEAMKAAWGELQNEFSWVTGEAPLFELTGSLTQQ